MNAINPTSRSAVALELLRPLGSASSTSPSKIAASTATILDPRTALTFSTGAADAILALVRANKHAAVAQVEEQRSADDAAASTNQAQIPSDEEFARSMADTPADLAAEMRAQGATKWIRDPEHHYSFSELERKVKDIIVNGIFHDLPPGIVDQIPPEASDPRKQAVLNGTAKIIRGNDIPELGIKNYRYYSYGPRGSEKVFGQISGANRSEINLDWLDKYQKNNPHLKISVIWFHDDMAIVTYPR